MRLVATTELDALARAAAAAPRGRAHLRLHADDADPVQRFFVAMDRRSYIRPHCHHTKSELAIVVRGSFDLVVFAGDGALTARHALGEDGGLLASETPAGCWHALIARQDGSVFLEVKQGPYDPRTAVEFAPWAPAENEAGSAPCLDWLASARIGERFSCR